MFIVFFTKVLSFWSYFLPIARTIINNTSKSTIFTLELDGEPCDCILREFQPNKLHTQILYVDFQVIKKGETIKMNIPVAYDGIETLSDKKLVLEKNTDKISIRGPVEILPEVFVVNISALNKGHKILANHLVLPSNTEILIHPETIIATIQ